MGFSSYLSLIKHETNKIEVLFSETGQILLRLNGMIGGTLVAAIAPNCDNLRLGVGFDDSRTFDGTVSMLITSQERPNLTLFGLPILLRTVLQFIAVSGSLFLFFAYLVFKK